MNKKSLVILISGSGSNLQAIIDAVAARQINATITAVVSNNPQAYGLERAANADIKTIIIDHANFTDRKDFDAALLECLGELNPDLVVLAGFMRILSDEIIDQYKGRIINIHPSLLPEFKGLNTHRRALEAGKKTHGASVHFVDNELDSGPVVIQAEIAVLDSTEEQLAKRVLEQEHVIFPLAIQWFAENKLCLKNNQVHINGKAIEKPAKWINNQLIMPDCQ